MKLLFCENCWDIFKLDLYELRQCKCGRVKGMYTTESLAVSNGRGRSLAIGNGSLVSALCGGQQFPYKEHKTFLAWVRPNDGPDNEHSTVDPNL